MTGVAEASCILDDLAAPRAGKESYKAVLTRVTGFVNRVGIKLAIIDPKQPISAYRIDDIWRKEARYVRSEEMDSIRAARDEKALGEVRAQRQTILDRLAALEARLLVADQNFHEPSADAVRGLARVARGEDRAGNPLIARAPDTGGTL